MRNCLHFNLRQLFLLCTLAALAVSGQLWKFISLGNAPIVFALSMILYDLLGSRRRADTRQPEAKPVFIDGAR